jgi:glucose/arabinose dehydrogenase
VGLLDLALDPKFASNNRIFFTYSELVGQANSHIVVARARLDEAGNALKDVMVIFGSKPDLPKTQSANQGGRIAIGRDGNLFVTMGDRSKSPHWDMAQKLDNDLGKMIHITPDGAPAPGNPFIGKERALPETRRHGSAAFTWQRPPSRSRAAVRLPLRHLRHRRRVAVANRNGCQLV